ncbi:hypothetical protein [Saccharothrix xinjiangensis]|uniref:Capsular polysaccharide biosynthesis protein n=1 Tax=Saccharothrix xinjiangensis TaxID=204798 RepID=A0ABV9YAV4_9PSEU
MDFWGALRVLRRRWYIALPSALLAVGLAAGVFVSIPTRYESTGVMVFTSPSAGGTFSENVSPEEAVKINPLLAFDGSLSTTSQIIAQILADPKTREKLGIVEGSTANFTASGGGQNGPFMFVVTDCESPDEAEKLVTTVLEFARSELDSQQRKLNAPEPTFITSQVIVNPTAAEAQIGGKVRYAGAAFVLMMLFTLAATFASDSVMGKLKRRKEAEAEAAAKAEEDAEAGAEAAGSRNAQNAQNAGNGDTAGRGQQNVPQAQHGQQQGQQGLPQAQQRPPLDGQPRRPEPQAGAPVQRPPARRQPTAAEQTVKVQPTASEKTVKMTAVSPPDQPKPGAPTWPAREDPR